MILLQFQHDRPEHRELVDGYFTGFGQQKDNQLVRFGQAFDSVQIPDGKPPPPDDDRFSVKYQNSNSIFYFFFFSITDSEPNQQYFRVGHRSAGTFQPTYGEARHIK